MSCLKSKLLISSMVLLVFGFLGVNHLDVAFGQEKDPNASGMDSKSLQSQKGTLSFHKEKMGDLPKRAASEDPTARSPRGVFERGPFISVQVNVDSMGQNSVGDAANEPSIAVDPLDPDKIVIGWRQFDTVTSNFRQAGWSYSNDGGSSWTFPGVLTPGTFRSDPVLDFNADGIFYYYSLKGDFTCDMFISSDSGVNWDGPYPAWGGDKNWMGVDRTSGMGQDNLYCTWTGYNNFTRSTDGGYTYMSPISSEFYWGTISVGPDGKVYICGWAGGNDYWVQRSSNAQNPGVTPSWDLTKTVDLGGQIVYGGGPNPGGLLGQVWIATNHSTGMHNNEVYLLATVDPPGGDPEDVHFVRSTDQGVTWSNPVRVNDDPTGNWQWFGTMGVAPKGRLDVVWNDTRNTGQTDVSQLFYAYSMDGGITWSENVEVSPPWNSHIGWPQQSKIGDYYDIVSHDEWAHVAYAATLNGEQDVYYVKVFPDWSLDTDVLEISGSTGGVANFSLDAGVDHQHRSYILLGSLSGTEPGFLLPGGLETLPLNWDAFTDFIAVYLNSTVFSDFLGTLDASGTASAQLNAPPSHAFVGVTMYYAYALGNPWDFVSNPVAIKVVP